VTPQNRYYAIQQMLRLIQCITALTNQSIRITLEVNKEHIATIEQETLDYGPMDKRHNE
jgi:hypothetical protein